MAEIQNQSPVNKSDDPSNACPPQPFEISKWILLRSNKTEPVPLDYIQINERRQLITWLHILCIHAAHILKPKWFNAIQSQTRLLVSFLSPNRRFMTQGDNMYQAMFSAFRASIMYISSLSQTFHLSCLPILMHHVGTVCLKGAIPYAHLPCFQLLQMFNIKTLYSWFLEEIYFLLSYQ